jgi:uncharacterized protein with PQ loop repeat
LCQILKPSLITALIGNSSRMHCQGLEAWKQKNCQALSSTNMVQMPNISTFLVLIWQILADQLRIAPV